MSQNILINRTRALTTRLNRRNYFDYMFYRGNTVAMMGESAFNKMMIADFSPKGKCFTFENGKLFSNVTWESAVNDGVTLKNIGFTGVDNGFIGYDKHKISNEAFLDLFFSSEYTIPAGENRLFLSPVSGNTARFEFPIEENCEYLSFKGGFYQGFYKLAGSTYQVLPNGPQGEMIMHFVIKPTDYETPENIVNNLHPENKGIFFYMGLRGENKFWPYYNVVSSVTDSMIIDPDHVDEVNPKALKYTDVTPDYMKDNDGYSEGYLDGPCDTDPYFGDTSYSCDNYMHDCKDYTDVKGGSIKEKQVQGDAELITERVRVSSCPSCGNVYKTVTKWKYSDPEVKYDESDCEPYMNDCSSLPPFDDDYMAEDVEINEKALINSKKDSDGNSLNENGQYTIESDNKFLYFDRTCEGMTADRYEEGMKVRLKMFKQPNINLFPLLSRSCDGYTTETIGEYLNQIGETNTIDIIKDSLSNAFALRVTDEGAIGYKAMFLDCESEERYTIKEEYSKEGMIKKDEWNDIVIRFMQVPTPTGSCDNKPKTMKILIYVNGYLKLISKELPNLNFRELDEVPEKQEGVPYNISLGGGTLGLLETITPDYYKVSNHLLPIEKNFCGTFIGDIKAFQIYDGFADYHSIKNYLSKNKI